MDEDFRSPTAVSDIRVVHEHFVFAHADFAIVFKVAFNSLVVVLLVLINCVFRGKANQNDGLDGQKQDCADDNCFYQKE